jgi:hypothetical protein
MSLDLSDALFSMAVGSGSSTGPGSQSASETLDRIAVMCAASHIHMRDRIFGYCYKKKKEGVIIQKEKKWPFVGSRSR